MYNSYENTFPYSNTVITIDIVCKVEISTCRPELRTLVGKREKVEFAQTVDEYNRRFKVRLLMQMLKLKFK